MVTDSKSAHRRHVELAQKILDIAQARGLNPGARLAEQSIAALCHVSRTPVRKAFEVLAARGVLRQDPQGGYLLALDPASVTRLDEAQGQDAEDDARAAILRDLAAGRIGAVQTITGLQRRYGGSRLKMQATLLKLAEANLAERGAGQHWRLKPLAVTAESLAQSAAFRLALEPLALTMPDFKRDPAALLALRQSMLALQALPQESFDHKLFLHTAMTFHTLIARSCGNPFLAEALLSHHTRRFALPGAVHGSTFRRMRANDEHIQILEQIERGRMSLAADLMRVHIQQAQAMPPRLAGRGVPPTLHAAPR